MNVVVRADAAISVGSGHIMRCLTLSQELARRQARCTFICQNTPGHLGELIERQGFAVRYVAPNAQASDSDATDPTENFLSHFDWQRDAAATAEHCAALGKTDWLIMDHYGIDERWEKRLRPHARHLFVIDDRANRRHDCDALLDQNLYEQPGWGYRDLVPSSATLLIGPEYALLRDQFREARRHVVPRDGQVRRVLIFLGGSDPLNLTAQAIQAVAEFAGPITFDVVVGETNPQRENIRARIANAPGFRFLCQVANMAELMSAADLAIGAAGTATWERCALGLPSLVVVSSDNQDEVARQAAARGLLALWGRFEQTAGVESIRSAFSGLLKDPERLRRMSRACLEAMPELLGPQRVAETLERLS